MVDLVLVSSICGAPDELVDFSTTSFLSHGSIVICVATYHSANSSHPSLFSSHSVVCSLARLATSRGMHFCSLAHCRWSVHIALDDRDVDVLPLHSDLHQHAVDRLPLHQALLHSFLQEGGFSLVLLVVVCTTV